jgi:hypothetical protein
MVTPWERGGPLNRSAVQLERVALPTKVISGFAAAPSDPARIRRRGNVYRRTVSLLVGGRESPYTEGMVRALGVALTLMMVTSTARADESPCPLSGAAPVATEPSGGTPSAEERAFLAELERFARLRAFTEQLVAKREADEFERATLRQARIAKLKRELTEREAAISERELEAAVALYLKKRELTRELAAAAAHVKPAPAGSTNEPFTPSLPR